MAQSGYTPILIYASGTTGNTPSASNLTSGSTGAELAINYYDGKLFYKDSGGVVQVLATKAGAFGTVTSVAATVPSFLSISGSPITSSGTLAITLSGTALPTTSGGTGLTSFTANQVFYASSTSAFAQSANLQFSGTDLTVYGITVGRGAGAVSTNTAVGASALAANTTGGYNTAVGYQAGYSNTTGTINAFGAGALYSNTTGVRNAAFGAFTLNANTTGSYNSAFGGYDAGLIPPMYYNTTGSYNTAMGNGALASNTTASNNTAVGYQAGYSNTTGDVNTFVGYQSGYSNVTGAQNTFIGRLAGYSSTGNANTFIGMAAGYASTGTYNTFIGYSSLGLGSGQSMTTGTRNTILGGYTGNNGGLDIRTLSNYIVLSDGDGNPRLLSDNVGNVLIGTTVSTGTPASGMVLVPGSAGQTGIYLGHANGTTTGAFYAGFCYNAGTIGSITQTGTTAVLYNTTSDYRLKSNVVPVTTGLSVINQLNPVNFTWISDNESDTGFLAHEFQTVIPRAVTGTKDATIEEEYEVTPAVKDEQGNITTPAVMGTRTVPVYQQMDNSGAVPYLVAAIKELSAQVTALQAKVGGWNN